MLLGLSARPEGFLRSWGLAAFELRLQSKSPVTPIAIAHELLKFGKNRKALSAIYLVD